MSEAGDTGTQNGTGTEGAENTAPDPNAALLERMDEFSSEFRQGLDGLSERFEQLQPQDQFEQDDTGLYDPYSGDQLDADLFDDDIDPREAQAAQERLQQWMQSQTAPLAQQIQAQQDQLDQMRVRGEANDVAREFPDLDNPEIAKPVMDAATRHVQRLGLDPSVANEPWFIRLTYLAGRAEEQAQQETPAGGQDGVQLEGGGMSPQTLSDAADEFGDRIVNAGPKSIFG